LRSHVQGLPLGDPAADVILRFADELDARATELEMKGQGNGNAGGSQRADGSVAAHRDG